MDFSFKELTEEHLSSTIVREFLEYWNSIKGSRSHPSLSDIDFAGVPAVEPYLLVGHITYPPFAVNYGYLGAQIIHYYKRDFTGEYLHDIFDGPMLRHYEVPHRIAMMRPAPLLGIEDWPGTKCAYEWGIFPCSEDGITINANIVIEDYSRLNRDELPDFNYKK